MRYGMQPLMARKISGKTFKFDPQVMEDVTVKITAKLTYLSILFLAVCSGCAATQSSVQIETNVYKQALDASSSPACDLTARISFESRS